MQSGCCQRLYSQSSLEGFTYPEGSAFRAPMGLASWSWPWEGGLLLSTWGSHRLPECLQGVPIGFSQKQPANSRSQKPQCLLSFNLRRHTQSLCHILFCYKQATSLQLKRWELVFTIIIDIIIIICEIKETHQSIGKEMFETETATAHDLLFKMSVRSGAELCLAES